MANPHTKYPFHVFWNILNYGQLGNHGCLYFDRLEQCVLFAAPTEPFAHVTSTAEIACASMQLSFGVPCAGGGHGQGAAAVQRDGGGALVDYLSVANLTAQGC